MQVMLVEDEDHKVADIKKYLVERYQGNLKLTLAKGVREAVKLVYGNSFDLIVLDMNLPTFSERGVRGGLQQPVGGIEVIRALHELGKKPKLIIITQFPDILLNGESVPLLRVASGIAKHYHLEVTAAILYSYKASEWEQFFRDALRKLT